MCIVSPSVILRSSPSISTTRSSTATPTTFMLIEAFTSPADTDISAVPSSRPVTLPKRSTDATIQSEESHTRLVVSALTGSNTTSS